MRAGFQGVQKRIEKVMDVQLQKEMAQLESRLLVLATVGSTAPFVGLFGTVWGIMNSFQAIAVSKNTNLAVVAPGLAEALFATAPFLPPFQRSFSTTNSRAILPRSGCGWRILPTSFPPSYRGSWTSGHEIERLIERVS